MEFSIGTTQKYREAKALPTGARVKIVSIEPVKSEMLTKKHQTENPGSTEEVYQGLVLFEALTPGTTATYETGRAGQRRTVAAEPYQAGDIFRHYFNGVYATGNPEKPWRLSAGQNFATFLKTLIEVGGPKTTKFEDFVGLGVVMERLKGMGAQGVYYTPMPQAVFTPAEAEDPEIDTPPTTTPAKPAGAAKPGKKIGGGVKKSAGAAPAAPSAFEALPADDKAAMHEYIEEVGGTAFAEPEHLVGTVASDIEHAKAIIASYKGA